MHIEVNLAGNWKLYTTTLPFQSVAIGTVTRNGYDTGALVYIRRTGLYVQVNANGIRSLPQREVKEAIRRAEAKAGVRCAGA